MNELTVNNGSSAISLFFILLAFTLHLGLLFWLRPVKLVGDENEYVSRQAATGAGKLWVRVPLFRWLLSINHPFAKKDNDTPYRIFNGLIGSIAIGISTWYVTEMAGIFWGIFSGITLIILIERAILAIHLWPETLLGLLLICFCIFAETISSETSLLCMGIITALAFATRVDYISLLPVGFVLLLFSGDITAFKLLMLTGPFAITALALSIFNGLNYRIWLPDTTLLFNIRVFKNEMNGPNKTVETLMRETSKEFSSGKTDKAKPNWSPINIFYHYARRLKNIIGEEVFISENLLQANKGKYSEISIQGYSKIIKLNLSYFFTFLLFVYLAIIAFIPLSFTLAIGAMIFAASAIQTRGRYRVALIPAISTGIALGFNELFSASSYSWNDIGLGFSAVLVAAAVMIAPRRYEITQ